MKTLALVTALLATAARAEPEPPTDPLSLSTDSQYALAMSYAESEAESYRYEALDLRTGERTPLGVLGPEDFLTYLAKERAVPGGVGKKAALWPWLKQHPIRPAKSSRTSPDGKATAEVLTPESDAGRWRGGTWSPDGNAAWTLAVTRDGKSWPSVGCDGGDQIAPFWSPDGTRIVWRIHHNGKAMRDVGYDELLVGPVAGPRIALVAPKAGLPKAIAEVMPALGKTGFIISRTMAAQSSPKGTEIQMAPGFEVQARALAQALPGSSVVAQQAPTSFDLIVALAP